MFQRILVPVDLTQKSLAAVDLAYDFAVLSKAEVTLLHIIETVEYVQFDEMKGFYKRLEESARTGLEEFSQRFATSKISVNQAVVYGHRSQQIVEFAVNNRADLIIMASHRIDPDRPGHDWSSISYARPRFCATYAARRRQLTCGGHISEEELGELFGLKERNASKAKTQLSRQWRE